MRRELRTVDTDEPGGYVEVDADGTGRFVGPAADIFRGLRAEVGDDDALAAGLVEQGWSNGYVYLAPAEDPSIDEIRSMADDEGIERAAGHDVTLGHDELHHYWVEGEGRHLWVDSPTPWRTLYALVTAAVRKNKRAVPPEVIKTWVSRWFIEAKGYAAGSDRNRVEHGLPPRGHKVGPG
jgi:hypothetical protein